MIKDVKIVHWEKHKKFYIHAVLELKQLASKEAAVKATVHSPHSVHGKRLRRTLSPDFVIVSPKNLRQRVLLFSDVLPSALFGYKPPCSKVA